MSLMMGSLYLVRHGQASFGATDYDQLSDLGHRQAERLGTYWAERGMCFDAVLTGALKRHAQTWAGIAQGAHWDDTPTVWPGLNEYNSEALIHEVLRAHSTSQERPSHTPDDHRAHFRLLRDGLKLWMDGSANPPGMPRYGDFVRGITDALDHVRTHHAGQRVLMVSSGGPIAAAVGHVLGLSPQSIIDLNMRIRNSAVTEFVFNPKRHSLLTYNTLPHLNDSAHAAWVTYA